MLEKQDLQILENTLDFWGKLTASQRNDFLSRASCAFYPKGTHMNTALKCVGLLICKQGTLRVSMLSEEGREITLYCIETGDVCILSASCALKAITFDVSIEAITDCELLRIDSSTFSSLMKENIYAEAYAYRLTTERFSDVMWAMQQLLFLSFDKRLAAFLLDETVKTETDCLKMTHEEIAKLLGSAREVVSRMLKYFSTEGLVKLGRGEILILNRKGLKKLT